MSAALAATLHLLSLWGEQLWHGFVFPLADTIIMGLALKRAAPITTLCTLEKV